MKSQLNKILTLIIIFLFFSFSKSYSIEGVNELTDAINEAREEFNNLSETSNEQSKIIDEAIKEIDKATEYVQEAIDNNNTEDAIKTLEFIERSLTDVQNIIPQEFGSDMSNIDTSAIEKDDMAIITDITKQMNVAKEKKLNEFMSDLVDLNQKGIDTISISEKLNTLGIDTIKISLDISEGQNIETWTKEQWAESYNGSILTRDGTDVADKEISAEVVNLEQKLEANNLAIIDKRSSLAELQTQIDPLSNQITDLKTQKTNLLAKYNEEILKQSSTILSDEEINKSKDLADQFNNELSNITNQISIAEQQSSSLQQQVQDLNIELTNEIANKSQLQNNIKDLNNQLSANQDILSKKTLELDQLKNTDLNKKINSLNEQLDSASRERDFIQTQFERSIDKEVEHFQIYANVFSDDMSEVEIDFAFKEVGALLSGDPRKTRAFDIEKYGTFAGLSKSEIQSGIDAALNDDWGTQKKVVKNIYNKLSKNPGWVVDVPSEAGLNVLIAEEQAIQEAVFVMSESRKVQNEVDKIINERTAQYQDFASIDTSKVSLAFTRAGIDGNLTNAVVEGTKEGKLVANQLNEILKDNEEFNQLEKSIKEKDDLLTKIVQENKNYLEMINQFNSEQSKINNEIWEINGEVQKLNFEKNKFLQSINETDPTVWGGLALINRGQGLPDHSKWVSAVKEFDQKIGELNNLSTLKSTEAWNKVTEQNIAMREFKTSGDHWTVMNELNNLKSQSFKIQSQAADLARKNVVDLQKQAVEEVNKIRAEEIAKTNGLYNTEDAVFEILDKIPTFDEAQRKRAKEVISGGYYATTGAQIVGFDDKAAGLIAALDSDSNTYEAFKAAVDNVKKIGKTPVIESPYYEMTNVKLAAIVHSRLNGNYDYMNFNESDKLQLSTADRAKLEEGLAKLYGSNNPKLAVLNNQIDVLKSEINVNSDQLQNLNENISKLESELTSLKNSENAIQTQINDLSNQFNSKESLISEKTQNIASLQEQLNPISERMNELQSQRAELDTKLNNQLNTIASQVENQEQVSDEAKALKEQFESQIAELDNQLKNYENQSAEINTQLTSITSELNTLEAETRELANQIESLNQDLKNFENIKADLAMATAKKLGLTVNEKAIESVEIIDGKAIVSLKGTDIVKIVDQNMLIDGANSLVDPISELSKNRKIYTANALNPALITPEFIEASKSIEGIDKLKILSETTALDVGGATTEQAAKMASAKAARLAARKDWDEAKKSGDKAARAAAHAAWVAAKDAEQVAGLEVAQAVATASAAAEAVTKGGTVEAAQEAAQKVASVAKDAAADIQDTIEATQAAQQAALDALWELEGLPGSTNTHTLEVTAAIRQLQAEMHGNEYSFYGYSSYEETMEAIRSGELNVDSHMNWDYEKNPEGHDPNRKGKCGKASC